MPTLLLSMFERFSPSQDPPTPSTWGGRNHSLSPSLLPGLALGLTFSIYNLLEKCEQLH